AFRLLMPPGVCACQLSSPAARLAWAWSHGEPLPPPPSQEPDDDHTPGCPASPFAVGMYVKPSPVPLRPPLTFDHPPQPDAPPSSPAAPAPEADAAPPLPSPFRPPGPALYLTGCTFLL